MLPARKHARRLAGLFVSLMLVCPLLAADASGPEYQVRKDYAMEWAGHISLFGVLGAVGLIGYVLVVRRRHLATAASQWILFIGICIMPLPIMVLGSAVGLERAKDVSFCRHCHVMRLFVTDMENPEADRLAAVHFKNRYIQQRHCYICHTDYGLFGTVEAKLAGVTHIWREATGSYTLPVRISKPYRFTICLDCHGQSAKYNSVSKHAGLVPRVVSGEATCTSCHGPGHLDPEKRGGSNGL